ncbi:HD domain-containing protein [Candidatus Dependentiae bacterium]|jgi:uncharacterized protein|nr:HD domain-containing protein [Candidatus Dependentiae bacterium]
MHDIIQPIKNATHDNFIIEKTIQFVRSQLEGEGTGHDWWHVHRVYSLALRIAQQEQGADIFVVSLGALLHDIADYKFHHGDESVGPRVAGQWLEQCGVQRDVIDQVQEIIKTISFKGAGVATPMRTLEGKIVQDADRLDALGAIGIARCFAYGGSKGNLLHDPEIKPVMHTCFETYKKSKGTSVNHFFEKLFLLKDLMNTKTAKIIAQKRHNVMEQFIKEFLSEWDGNE